MFIFLQVLAISCTSQKFLLKKTTSSANIKIFKIHGRHSHKIRTEDKDSDSVTLASNSVLIKDSDSVTLASNSVLINRSSTVTEFNKP